jgi:hypothetical protein
MGFRWPGKGGQTTAMFATEIALKIRIGIESAN